ncbi:uncharacterized protein ACJ7VT_020478 [Polymixia lowei]
MHDSMFFNTTVDDDSQLRCAVNVSSDPGFVLSVYGGLNKTLDSVPGDQCSRPYVQLSRTIPLKNGQGGQYQCQLHLNGTLVHTKIFHSNLPEPGGEVTHPQPWFLYATLLLIPVTVLLALLTAMLLFRC